MKFIVTGSAGFIGYNLCKRLLEGGNEVLGIDKHTIDYDVRIKQAHTNELSSSKFFEFIKLDINNEAFKSKIMLEDRKVDYFFHLASKDMYYGSTEHVDYAPFVETNVLGTTNAFDLSRHLGVKKFIYVSSHSVYGDIGANLMDEENSVPKPISPNGASKLSAEHVIQFMSNFYKNSAIILRAFSVYGPGMRPQTFIPLVIDRLIKDLPLHSFIEYHNKRDFIYIEDAVRYILLSLKEENQFQIVNIASGNSYSLEQIALKIAKIMKKDPSLLEFKRHSTDFDRIVGVDNLASVSKAKEILKYIPIFDIDEGLTRTVEWYLKNPDILEVSTHH